MSSWSTKRQFSYIGLIIIFLILLFSFPTYKYLNKAPTCSDSKQNGNENGVDCGGNCQRICSADAVAPIIHWQRVSRVSKGFYNALAYVENANAHAWLPSASYIFRLYDSNNILIAERSNSTFLPPNKISPIYEGRISTGERIPARVTFEFTNLPSWQKISVDQKELIISKKVLSREDTLPRVDATVVNPTLQNFKNVEMVAVIFDGSNNAIAFSKSFLETLPKTSSADVVFTWREPFVAPAFKIEVIPRANPTDQ